MAVDMILLMLLDIRPAPPLHSATHRTKRVLIVPVCIQVSPCANTAYHHVDFLSAFTGRCIRWARPVSGHTSAACKTLCCQYALHLIPFVRTIHDIHMCNPLQSADGLQAYTQVAVISTCSTLQCNSTTPELDKHDRMIAYLSGPMARYRTKLRYSITATMSRTITKLLPATSLEAKSYTSEALIARIPAAIAHPTAQVIQ